MSADAPTAYPKTRRPRVLLAAVLLLGALVAVYLAAARVAEDRARRDAGLRLDLYVSTLVAALERHQHLPFVLAMDPNLVEGASGRGRLALNQRLERIARAAGVEAIYLMDPTGLTIAASNWNRPDTFLGQNYAFRPYFSEALAGGRGEFFAIGATTARPGYFVAEPVRDSAGAVLGVVAIKIDLEPLAQAWRDAAERVLVANRDGVVLLASDPELTYRTLAPLPAERRAAIAERRQFGAEPLDTLDWRGAGEGWAVLDGTRYIHGAGAVGRMDWMLHFLADDDRITEQARFATSIAAIVLSLGLLGIVVQRSRRIRDALRASQDESRGLQALNASLAREIEDRRRAEAELARAQKDLAQAGKLAALGQLSASVTHELGQPIAAMQNYLASLRMNGAGDIDSFVARMEKVTRRMDNITRQLRFFAKPAEDPIETFDLRRIVGDATDLVRGDLDAAEIALAIALPDEPVPVRGQRLRLEQVLVNLIRNARDALSGSEGGRIRIELGTDVRSARLVVSDNGPGIDPAVRDALFDPFVTTKSSGSGMGLGLAISAAILAEHDGRIDAGVAPDGGAAFEVVLPIRQAAVPA